MAEIVKITCGQPFVVYLPLVILNADGSKEAVDASALTDVVVKLQAQGMDDVTVTTEAYEQYLVLNIPGTMPVAEYNIIVNANLPNDRPFTLRMSHALGVMSWDWQTNWRDYLVGEHIELCDQPFIAGEFTTDAEYEALKQQLREQIAAAEQAEEEAIAEKEQYAEALEHLDDIAKQGDNPNATNTQILYDVNHLVVPPPTGMALESTLTAGITALQNAITALYGGDLTATLSALKTAIANISIDTSDLAKANALAAVQSDIDALEVLVGTTADTSTDATIFGKLAAVLAAVAGISGFATPQNVIDAKDAVIAAMPSVSGLATEANATVNKQAVLNALAAAEAALQGGDQTATLTALKQAVAAIVIPTDYAKETTAQQAATDAAAAKTAAQAITIPTDYAKQGNDSTATNTALLNVLNSISTNMYKGVPVQTQTGDATIAPNVWNVWASVAGNLTITKGTDIANIVNEYMVRFKLVNFWSGQITFNGFSLNWNGGSEPVWTDGYTYEISIINNIALWTEIAPAS